MSREGTPGSRKPRKAAWRELPPDEMAAHLIATPTISDGAWTSESRLPGEARADFVHRVLVGETPRSSAETPAPDLQQLTGSKQAGLKSGYYLLNTDGGNSGNPSGGAAIGALLRTRRLVAVAQISKPIGPATHNVAEYGALIEGLKLARDHGVQHIRVYMDSELVVEQLCRRSAVKQERLKQLHKDASSFADLFKSFRIAWVPREMNAEADRLVRDVLDRN
jgi:ribonuclease HI